MNVLLSKLTFYILFWFSWFIWVQTVGRTSFGLSFPSVLLYDALFVGGLYYFYKKSIFPQISKQEHAERVRSWFDLKPKDLSGPLKWIAAATLFSIVIMASVQVPFDWDGMDYHLPPLVEAWKNGQWAHSVNPYFSARTYPKTVGVVHLWWIAHFGKFWGLSSVLFMGLLFWEMGLIASYYFLGRNKWTFLFWLAFPLVAKLTVSGYADLAALSALLAFAVFIFRREYWFASFALGLHGAAKFTNLLSGGVALLAVVTWWKISEGRIFHRWKNVLQLGFVFLAIACIQPVENLILEGKPFGELQCKVLGKDYCNGSIDPNTLVVSPTIDIDANWSWPKKVFEGWKPNQLIPETDVPHGGLGFVWIIPFFLFLFSLTKIKKQHLHFLIHPTFAAILLLLASDLLIPAKWYARYHMALGWVFMAGSVLYLNGQMPPLFQKNSRLHKLVYGVVGTIMFMQLLWLFPHRIWFLGTQENRLSGVVQNIKSIFSNGYPATATHSADKKSIEFYSTSNQNVIVCGNRLRPILAAYGADLTNDVTWNCELAPTSPPSGIVEGTKYWLVPKN